MKERNERLKNERREGEQMKGRNETLKNERGEGGIN
jgi:hypothetical protein